MTGKIKYGVVLAALLLHSHPTPGSDDAVLDELDAFWAEVATAVIEGDFEAYGKTYHEDAILVSGPSKSSYLIGQALEGWKPGFADTRSGKTDTNLEFRFTQRLNDAASAHETGIFFYATQPEGEQRKDTFVHFEALLIRQNGWKMMMEYQKSPATRVEWDAAR
jgi:hypothetical protein